MHFSNLVIIEKPEGSGNTIKNKVANAMGPHEDDGGFWDWYQIGGRWTGIFDEYDPATDQQNVEICGYCGGTGFRNDSVGLDARKTNASYTCNACGEYDNTNNKWTHGPHGPGRKLKWPTQWTPYKGDIIPIENLTQEMLDKFYRIVIGGSTFGGQDYLPWKNTDAFMKRERPPLKWLQETYANHLCVVVDNHR